MWKKNDSLENSFQCPCGSGKLPWDCCFKDAPPSPKPPRFPIPNQNLAISELSRYNQIEIISAIAGLQIYSKNHSYIPRLVSASQLVCSIKTCGNETIKNFDLHGFFTVFFPPGGEFCKREDPPEECFTENIEFGNGNNIVYSGISVDGGSVLRTILRSFTLNKGELSDDFFNEVIPKILALLLLSNEVAVRAGHERYLDSETLLWGEIEIPEIKEFDRLRKAVIFSDEDIKQLFSPYGLDSKILESFVMSIGSSKFLKGKIDDNPLYEKPLVKIKNTLILAVPSAIVGTLRHTILMAAKKHKKIKQLSSLVTNSYWIQSQISLDLLGFKSINLDLPPLGENIDLIEGIYQFDKDKIAYVQLVVDNAESYQQIYPVRLWVDHKRISGINKRYEKITSWLQENKKINCKYVFFIPIIGIIGRYFAIRYTREPKDVRVLGLTSENLDVFARTDECDCLKLWKFVGFVDELSSFHEVYAFSTLDLFAFYLTAHAPRDSWEKPGPAAISIKPGTAQEIRIAAIKKADIHEVQSGNPPGWITVTRWSEDPAEPVYVPEGSLIHPHRFLVKGYKQPIWVDAGPIEGRIHFYNFHHYFQFIDTFSYWIWQLTESLQPHLEILGDCPIHIRIEFENFYENGIIDTETNEKSVRAPAFRIEKETRTIFFTINSTIFKAIDEENNSGERCLVKTLLISLGNLLEVFEYPNTLNAEISNTIIEKHAPLGKKRKLSSVSSSSNASLDPRWIPSARMLQVHDITEQYNGLQKELDEEIKKTDISTSENGIELYHISVKIYLNRLKLATSKYSWISLLSKTILQHEALIHYFSIYEHNLITSMHTYGDLQTGLDHFISNRELFDNTSIATRNLIEIISAEPPSGENDVSITDFDSLLALSHHFSHLGSAGDSIFYGLFTTEPQTEGDDAIAENPTTDDIKKFYEEKYREGIEVQLQKYSEMQSPEEPKKELTETDLKVEWQKAFKAEFGLTLFQMIQFFGYVTDLGIELETSVPHLPLSEFKRKIKSTFNWSDEDINLAIKQFSLVPRDKYEIAPAGYDRSTDIFPWVFNRRISYIVRPFIIGPEPKDDPLIFWGPRNVYEVLEHIRNNIISGRYPRDAKTSPEMKALISRFENKFAKFFEKDVEDWFRQNTSWDVHHAVFISPNGKLHSEINYGDIDVLAIDIPSKKIFSIECKNLNFGRNPREIATEIRKILGNEGDRSSLIKKHLTRDDWLKTHFEVVRSAYNLPDGDFEIVSLFVVSEELATTYLREIPLPIIPISRLRREGVKVLE